ncbi:putative WD repeat-containing protein C3H5.08c [Dichanthelium oligosanthes]|uniref:Putative WD repeat-containing protein C3H5.08c n=1 Tax=Dichanthelium oligosanthes TaxID=888268 RepID=A0A1E5VH27_9POAL|nr:putative WD repeat-containing protein C3H5.08c [Dichanthelium oligosanthes]
MPRSESDSDDIFFDAFEDVRSAREPSSSEDCSTSDDVSAPRKFEYDIWASEPMSVQERRQRFLKGMGFDEFVSTRTDSFQGHGEITAAQSFTEMEERNSSLDSSVCDNESEFDGACCIRDMDSGKRYIVNNGVQSSLTEMLKEVGSDKVMSLLEFESLLGLSRSVQKLLRRGCGNSSARETNGDKKKNVKSLWKKFMTKRSFGGICKYDVQVKNCTTGVPTRTRVQHRKKNFLEFSAVYMDQEIRAHKGSIRVMKFSPSGWYLATGGEDCIVRIWQILEVEASPKLYKGEDPYEKMEKVQVFKTNIGKGQNHALAVIPNKAFRISESPLHEFHGHTSDILDMTWSKSDYLLTSSKDKTVRLWKPGCDGCLAVFRHKDYVTCVQFNPIDERYFISGSLDGKVRIWDVLDRRVTDWADTWNIITALSYQPDGKGFIVGTIAGACRFYNQSGENIQLEKELFVQGKKKSAASGINSLKLCTSDSNRIIITSADSKIRVADGGTIKKFEGPWKSKALSSPSLTSDGRYLISAGKDSNVYIWNYANSGDAKSVHSCELFSSKDVTTAVPWPGVHQDGHTKPSCLTEKPSSAPTLRRHGECRTFADGTKGSATWPEEKLPSAAKPESGPQLGDCLSAISAAWSTVIVTASRDGVIRSFPNYGLPVCEQRCSRGW